MINTLRWRFIIFSVIVITSIIIIMSIFILIESDSNRSLHGYVFTLLLIIAMVFIGSVLLSKMAIRPIRATWQKQLDFTADASHELRTPIAVIQTNLELVLDSPTQSVQSQMKWLQNIAVENQRMARLVEDLLTLSRADTAQQTLEKEAFMPNIAIQEALAPFEAIASTKGIGIELSVDGAQAFYGDRKRIKQLIAILTDNALHYTQQGCVSISVSQNEDALNIIVSDTGLGIEACDLGKIFDRFYRAANTRTLYQEGSGLGLSIAKWIVQEHGGIIRATSQAGRGTSFIIRLPNLQKG